MQPMLSIAIRAARNAGDIIVRSMQKLDTIQVTQKGKNDFTSDVDIRAEQEIIAVIHKSFPDHGILAEESGLLKGRRDEFLWIIDPLDGTINYLHGFPQFAVSIALKHKGKYQQAVVYDPLRQELFTASRGGGAHLNNRRLRVTKQTDMPGALIGTGFPFKHQQHLDAYLAMFKTLIKEVGGIRRAGAAALDLAYVAAGRLDGYWEIGVKEWGMAAGVLLVQEAGGIVTDFGNGSDYERKGNIIAASASFHKTIQRLIIPHVTDSLS
ncbi:MAG: inositol monophosphatase family protein [Methylococcales bacterium]